VGDAVGWCTQRSPLGRVATTNSGRIGASIYKLGGVIGP